MIVTKAIPINAQDFVRRCSHDCRLGKYAKDGNYLEFLITETRRSQCEAARFPTRGRQKSRQAAVLLEADHTSFHRRLGALPAPRTLRSEPTGW